MSKCKIDIINPDLPFVGKGRAYADALIDYLALEHLIESHQYKRRSGKFQDDQDILFHNMPKVHWDMIKVAVKRFPDKTSFLLHKEKDNSIEINPDLVF